MNQASTDDHSKLAEAIRDLIRAELQRFLVDQPDERTRADEAYEHLLRVIPR